MSTKYPDQIKTTMKALSAGAAAMMTISNPVTILFVLLMVMAGFALLNEQIILVGMISTLALLMGALGAGLLAMISVRTRKTLSPRGFQIFLGLAFVIPLIIWSFAIFNDIPQYPWLHVAGLATIMLVCALYLVPRLRNVFRSKGVMV